MAVIGFPFDNVEYDASALGAWLATRTRGVFSGEDHYDVTIDGDLSVSVSPGIAWLQMSDQWGIVAANPAAVSLAVSVGDGSLNRIDAVCLRINKNTSSMELLIKAGVPDVNPVLPSIERDLDYDEIYLASIYMPSGAIQITSGNVTDLRLNETYCGIMRDGVTSIPTQSLFDAWQEWFNQLETEADATFNDFMNTNESDFGAWFQNLQDQLDDNQAANLQNQITELENMFDATVQPYDIWVGSNIYMDGTAVPQSIQDMCDYVFDDDIEGNNSKMREISAMSYARVRFLPQMEYKHYSSTFSAPIVFSGRNSVFDFTSCDVPDFNLAFNANSYCITLLCPINKITQTFEILGVPIGTYGVGDNCVVENGNIEMFTNTSWGATVKCFYKNGQCLNAERMLQNMSGAEFTNFKLDTGWIPITLEPGISNNVVSPVEIRRIDNCCEIRGRGDFVAGTSTLPFATLPIWAVPARKLIFNGCAVLAKGIILLYANPGSAGLNIFRSQAGTATGVELQHSYLVD